MTRLTKKTADLLSDLTQSRSRAFASQSHQEALLEEIADSGESAALPSLVGWTLSLDPRIRETAVLAVRRLVEALPVHGLTTLDMLMRARFDWNSPWRELAEPMFNRYRSDDRVLLLRLATMHSSGFVREAAIGQLNRNPLMGDLPFLAVRLNDWVKEIRRCAHEGVKERLHPSNAVALVEALPLFARLAGCGRANSVEILNEITNFLRHENCIRALRSALDGPDPVVARTAFAFGAELDSSLEFYRLALRARDPIVRFRAFRFALEEGVEDLYSDVSGAVDSDPYFPIRRIVLENCELLDVDRGFERLKSQCLDRSRSIRAHCQQRLMFDFDFDVCEIYRGLAGLNTVKSQVAALQGLREVGGASDAALASEYLEAASPRVRAAALALLTKFDPARHRQRLVAALRDPSPTVQRAAIRVLETSELILSAMEIRELFRDAEPNSKVRILRVARSLSSWDCLAFLLEAGRDSNELVANSALEHFWAKVGKSRGLARPGATQLESFHRQLELSRPVLSDRALRDLDFIVRSSR